MRTLTLYLASLIILLSSCSRNDEIIALSKGFFYSLSDSTYACPRDYYPYYESLNIEAKSDVVDIDESDIRTKGDTVIVKCYNNYTASDGTFKQDSVSLYLITNKSDQYYICDSKGLLTIDDDLKEYGIATGAFSTFQLNDRELAERYSTVKKMWLNKYFKVQLMLLEKVKIQNWSWETSYSGEAHGEGRVVNNLDFAIEGIKYTLKYYDYSGDFMAEEHSEDDDIHILEGDVAAPSEDDLVTVTMGMPAPPHVYKEKRRVLYKECQIARITFHDLRDICDELYEGAELALVREKDNKHDKYAIAVALADDYDGDPDDFDFDFILGYVPRTENKHLATMLDLGWAEAFECELSQVNGSNPYKGSLYMKIYMVSKDEEEIEEPEHLLPVLEFDDKQIELFKSSLESKGFSCQRWGALLPDAHDFPDEGNKVVLLHRNLCGVELYLTHVVARGDNAKFFVKNNEEKLIDDCDWFVLTNVVGPVYVSNDDIKFLDNEPINKVHPEEYVSLQATEELYSLIYDSQSGYLKDLPEPM